VEGFSNVSFASPVSRNPTSDKERFNVRIQLEVDKLRKTLASPGTDGSDKADEAGNDLVKPLDTPAPPEPTPTVEQPKALQPDQAPKTPDRGRAVAPPKQVAPDEQDSDEESTDDEEEEESTDDAEQVTR
jgi:hypothetical protein